MKIKVTSFNMHKGYSLFKKSYTLPNIRHLLEELDPDIVFLQELHGHHPENYECSSSPLEELADTYWPHFRHGVNSIYSSNFHGNAIMSRFPITHWDNTDISTNFLEKRGLLHATIQLESEIKIDLFCTHLNLSPLGQYFQIEKINNLIREKAISPHCLLAGDFNDWSMIGDKKVKSIDQFQCIGKHKTYPSMLPILALDRIYYKGLELKNSSISLEFQDCSDHLPITAEFELF